MKIALANSLLATLIVFINVFFVPVTFRILMMPFGFSFRWLAVSLSINLLLISAALAFSEKHRESKKIFAINLVGFIWAIVWLVIIIY